MPYWIHDNGETTGPMRAIDVLRRAQPGIRVCDGETWFSLDDGPNLNDPPYSDTDHGESRTGGARLTIR